MSCSGRPPTSPPEPASPEHAAPHGTATQVDDPDLTGFAQFLGGRWLVPPRRPGALGEPGTHARALWLYSAKNADDALPMADQCLVLALPGDAATPELEHAARTAGTGVLAHPWRSSVVRAVAEGWRRQPVAVMLPGELVVLDDCGLLITGPAGSGKSEAALGLVDRGHRLVADDAFMATYEPSAGWIGGAEPRASGRLALRGLGICDLTTLYGRQAVTARARIGLEVQLDPDPRLSPAGLLAGERGAATLPGVPSLRLPAAPGRNLPLLLEVAVRQHAGQN